MAVDPVAGLFGLSWRNQASIEGYEKMPYLD